MDKLPTHLIEMATAMIGAALGAVAMSTWQRVCARLGDDHVWRKFAVAARSLVSDRADDSFLAHYFDLSRALVAYVGKRLLAGVMAFLPVVVVATLLAPVVSEGWPAPHERDPELAFFLGLALGSLLGWLPFRARRH